MRQAGYTKAGAYSGANHANIRKYTSKLDFFDPERIKADINDTRKEADLIPEVKDRVAAKARIDEHRAKIAGIIIDKSETRNLNPDKVVIVEVKKEYITDNRLNSSLPVDNPVNRRADEASSSLSS